MIRKQYGAHGLAGCVQITKSRATGLRLGIYHGEQSGLECGDRENPWVTVCEEHGTLVGHPTLRLALRTRSGEEFCDDCRALTADSEPIAE